MKNVTIALVLLLTAVLIISACNKYASLADAKKGQLLASAYKVDIAQPDTLLLFGAKATDTVQWSVIPSGFDSLITQNNKALVFFKKAGNYQVKAIDKGWTPATVSITVIDSVYHPVITYSYLQLTGDQITLVPHFYNNPTADSSYLSFVAQTKNSYCGSSTLVVADSLINNRWHKFSLRVAAKPLHYRPKPHIRCYKFYAKCPWPAA